MVKPSHVQSVSKFNFRDLRYENGLAVPQQQQITSVLPSGYDQEHSESIMFSGFEDYFCSVISGLKR